MSDPGAWPAWPLWLLLAAGAALAAGLLAWWAAMRVRRSGADASGAADREALLVKAAESEARLRALIELSSDWYWEMDESLRFTALRLGRNGRLMVPVADVLGKHRWDLPGELVQPSTWDEHKAALEARQPFQNLIMRRWTPDGSVVYHLSSGEPIFDAAGAFRGYRGLGKDITDQVRAQESIERLASYDSLTQLPNRQAFDDRAQQLLSSAYIEGRICALLYLDLDDFRLLNNSYGHHVGDQMLAIVAQRLRERVREPNLVGRRGGDELVALLVDVPRPEAAAEVARELIESIQQPVRIQGLEVSVTPSVGIGLFPQDGIGLDSLLSAADAAMYEAKERGKRTYEFCTPAVSRRVALRVRLEQRLRSFDPRDFRLFYQPLVSLADGKVVGAEALLRWKDPEKGDISPAEFIPIAEKSGLIIRVDDWVLREACRQRQMWQQVGLDVPPVAINMSGEQLSQPGSVDRTLACLREFGVAPGDIEIEVTETAFLDTKSVVSSENLKRLSAAGVKIVLDDFGVGFSSLTHLRVLPIHRLKIDQSFTVECMRDARTLTIVKAVIKMARGLQISVTAEGIETQAQQTWMQHLGCDSAQGFLFARPMSAEDFLKVFADQGGIGRERSLMH